MRKTKVSTHERRRESIHKEMNQNAENCESELLLCAVGHENFIVNKITGDSQENENFTFDLNGR